ncbi:hypothetical protein MUO79_06995 [Candidatus Bathyarchaeota archaeon]|nr:hypothetical protein [Candidatus Bathyarchaeota archaeon]
MTRHNLVKKWWRHRKKTRKVRDKYSELVAKSIMADYRLTLERLESNRINRELNENIRSRKYDKYVV